MKAERLNCPSAFHVIAEPAANLKMPETQGAARRACQGKDVSVELFSSSFTWVVLSGRTFSPSRKALPGLCKAPDYFAGPQVNHFDTVVPQCCYEKPHAFDVDGQMVHPPIDRQWDRLHESERHRRVLCVQRQNEGEHCHCDAQDSLHPRSYSLHN